MVLHEVGTEQRVLTNQEYSPTQVRTYYPGVLTNPGTYYPGVLTNPGTYQEYSLTQVLTNRG